MNRRQFVFNQYAQCTAHLQWFLFSI